VEEMTLGDLLWRLSLISPRHYRAIIAIAQESYKRLWPSTEDPVLLLDRRPDRTG
jgi:hypothetical protein